MRKHIFETGRIVMSVVIAVSMLTSCGALQNGNPFSSEEEAMPPYYQQLVVKFKPDSGNCDQPGVKKLSEMTRVKLQLIRPVERGNACVVRLYAENPDYFLAQQRILSEHVVVQWVEQDQTVRPF